MRNVVDFENDIAGLRSVISDKILEMAKGGTGDSEVPLGFDPSLPNINLAELMLGVESETQKIPMHMLNSLIQAEE